MSFRARLLVALVGSVSILGLASLAIVRLQTTRQIEWMVARTTDRTERALGELERFRHAELERIALRLTGSIRIAAALDAAFETGDADEFVEHVQYELKLAELVDGLVAFRDREGRPVVTLVNNERVGDHDARDELSAQVITGAKPASSGYRLMNGRLFAVQAHRLEMFGEPVGTLTLGFDVDDELVTRLGGVVDADICFVAVDRCVVGTPAVQDPAVSAAMVRAAHGTEPVLTTFAGHRVALVATPLAESGVATVIAVPLEDVLTPFDRIQQVERWAAGATLVVAVLLGIVLSKGLTTPIRALMSATERVRRGDYNFTVAVPHRDELGTLADAFNQMTQGLRLKERYRGVLDKVVSPRIAEELMKGEVRLGGETREVTTLFADVRGFTTATEHMAPELALAILNEWLEIAAASIEEEGGVVDKYVGDQVMAIFGAPIPQADHALRAVRAGLRLRDRTAALKASREANREPSFDVGIGVNTGPAVAGNTGSLTRLNYTVVGASVNVAARLCADAAPGEMLIAEETHRAVANEVEASPLSARVLKGFSRPVTPWVVYGPRRGQTARHPTASVVMLIVGLLLSPPPASAQIFDLPTLAELGLHFVSRGGLIEIKPSVQVDIDGFFPQDQPAWHLSETEPFLAGRGRVFVDLFIGRRLYALTELRVDRGQPARAGGLDAHVQQAFVRLTPIVGRNFRVQAGKFVSPVGSYPERAQSAADPFIRPPLMYDHRTVMSADFVPAANDGVFTWKDQPPRRASGLPIVWDVPYPVGAIVAGGGRGVALTVGATNTAPSADPDDWDRLDLSSPAGPSFVARASYQVMPEFQAGISYSRGSYLRSDVRDAAGSVLPDRQVQELRGIDATFRRGYVDVRAEIFFNRWDVFRVTESPRDLSYYLETRATLAPGLFAAVRYNAVHFKDLLRSNGTRDRWDYDLRRWQLGAGYRLGRSAEVRGEFMKNRTSGRVDPDDDLISLRWSWMF